MRIVPINNGYYQVKSINGEMFKSRISKAFGSVPSGVDIMTLDGQEYAIGEGIVEQNGDKTNTDFTKTLILNMLCRLMETKETFKLLITAPPLMFRQQKEILPGYLKGKYSVIHNGKPKEIIIEDVKVYPETVVAAFANNPQSYANKKLIVLDVGGVTTNGVLMTNNTFTKDDVFTIRNGMYHLDHKISQYINSQDLDLNCSSEDIEYFRQSHSNLLVKHIEAITDLTESFIGVIKKALDDMKWNYNAYDVLVIGGGGLTLFNDIKKILPQAKLSNDPIFDNLKGLEILSKEVF